MVGNSPTGLYNVGVCANGNCLGDCRTLAHGATHMFLKPIVVAHNCSEDTKF